MPADITREKAVELQQAAYALKRAFERFLKADPSVIVKRFDDLRDAMEKAEEIADTIGGDEDGEDPEEETTDAPEADTGGDG
jgi:hypothetical protein